jgi:hypothetical protein
MQIINPSFLFKLEVEAIDFVVLENYFPQLISPLVNLSFEIFEFLLICPFLPKFKTKLRLWVKMSKFEMLNWVGKE